MITVMAGRFFYGPTNLAASPRPMRLLDICRNAAAPKLSAEDFEIEGVAARLDLNRDIVLITWMHLCKHSHLPINGGHAPAGCAKIRGFVGSGHAAGWIAIVAHPNGGILADFDFVLANCRTYVFGQVEIGSFVSKTFPKNQIGVYRRPS